MFCVKCGNVVQDGDAFCDTCGAEIEPYEQAATPTGRGAGGSQNNAAPQPVKSALPNGTKLGIIIVAASIVIAAIIVIVALVLASDDASNENKEVIWDPPALTQEEKERAFVDRAHAEGKAAVSGTFKVQTWGELVDQRGNVEPNAAAYFRGVSGTVLVFWLDEPTTLTVHQSSGSEMRSQDVVNIGVSTDRGSNNIDPYVGQHVVIAFDPQKAYMYGDITGALLSVSVQASDITVFSGAGDDSTAGDTTPSVTQNRGEFLLPDSATRVYSESELRALSADELWYARNEIYARHGRQFSNATLATYFGSKSWYHGTIAPNDFDASVLNSVERANLDAIVAVERSINSPHRM